MRWLVCVALVLGACSEPEGDPNTDPDPPRIHTPAWAFEPWISKDISDGPDTRAFVDGFRERGIPVGVVVLDSPWETNYNTFVPNEERYPQFARMVSDLREQGVRTVLWVTRMVNDVSFDLEPGGDIYDGPHPDFDEAKERGWLVNGGQTYVWWKGTGAGVDFFHPEAVAWWRSLQDPLFEMGIAGWKLDFGEEYIDTEIIQTHAGPKTKQEYSEACYREFWEYGAKKLGTGEFVTMVRPWDESYGFPGRFFARPEHAPVCWVGDNRRDWVGLVDALDHIFRSAAAGYVMVGSDIGGYLDRDDIEMTQTIPFDVDVFLRWTALGAMTPFMQLHGRANITPWTVPERADETVAAWKYWATLHDDLVPFFYSLAEEAYLGGPNLLRPIGELDDWADDWRFTVGDAFLVAPIIDATGVRDVELPQGERWLDWWHPGAAPLDGGQTLEAFAVERADAIPLFLREGAIVPMRSKWLVVPGSKKEQFVLHEEGKSPTTITLEPVAEGHRLGGTSGKALRLEVWGEATGASVGGSALPALDSKDDFDAADKGVFREPGVLHVKTGASGALEVLLTK